MSSGTDVRRERTKPSSVLMGWIVCNEKGIGCLGNLECLMRRADDVKLQERLEGGGHGRPDVSKSHIDTSAGSAARRPASVISEPSSFFSGLCINHALHLDHHHHTRPFKDPSRVSHHLLTGCIQERNRRSSPHARNHIAATSTQSHRIAPQRIDPSSQDQAQAGRFDRGVEL